MANIKRNSDTVGIIDYGMGNLFSIANSLEYLQIPYQFICDSKQLHDFKKVILPGVGSYKHAMDMLAKKSFDLEIKKIVESNNIMLLGICLGMQLLYDQSEEDSGCVGMGVINGSVKCIDHSTGVRVPNIGWREIAVSNNSTLLKDLPDNPIFYFVHKYACCSSNSEVVKGRLDYGSLFDVVIENGNIFGTQFHPEKSQRVGLKVLENFVRL